eukprot:TRINITY_DN29393_c0_g1_i1.p1 TRINITY_DN29393_c0_g1~~TRINITY_DN29393_c0_g1_i1.p1  ORF type:complete len:332 (-),score=7.00 TRINITY_DN29393_c0_g1_i1:48-986(-)
MAKVNCVISAVALSILTILRCGVAHRGKHNETAECKTHPPNKTKKIDSYAGGRFARQKWLGQLERCGRGCMFCGLAAVIDDDRIKPVYIEKRFGGTLTGSWKVFKRPEPGSKGAIESSISGDFRRDDDDDDEDSPWSGSQMSRSQSQRSLSRSRSGSGRSGSRISRSQSQESLSRSNSGRSSRSQSSEGSEYENQSSSGLVEISARESSPQGQTTQKHQRKRQVSMRPDENMKLEDGKFWGYSWKDIGKAVCGPRTYYRFYCNHENLAPMSACLNYMVPRKDQKDTLLTYIKTRIFPIVSEGMTDEPVSDMM